LKGCLYWCINREWTDNAGKAATWPEAEWEARYVNVFTRKDNLESGQGNLVYPGPRGRLWPSIRIENVRDGIEDYEYMAMLDRLAAEARSGGRAIPGGLLAEIGRMLAIPDDVVTSTSRWTRDPAVLAAFRARVAAMIQEASRSNPTQASP